MLKYIICWENAANLLVCSSDCATDTVDGIILFMMAMVLRNQNINTHTKHGEKRDKKKYSEMANGLIIGDNQHCECVCVRHEWMIADGHANPFKDGERTKKNRVVLICYRSIDIQYSYLRQLSNDGENYSSINNHTRVHWDDIRLHVWTLREKFCSRQNRCGTNLYWKHEWRIQCRRIISTVA